LIAKATIQNSKVVDTKDTKQANKPILKLEKKPSVEYIFKDFTIYSNYSLGFGTAREVVSNMTGFREYKYNIFKANQFQAGVDLNDYLLYLSITSATAFDDSKYGVEYGSLSLGLAGYKFTLPYAANLGFAYMLPYVGFESGFSWVLKTTTKTYWGWNNSVDLGGVIKLYFTDSLEFRVILSSTKTFWSLGDIKALDIVDSSIFRFGVNYRYNMGDLIW
jgi:hypothetical protein